MADVVITRPEPGTKQSIASPEQGNFIFDFNTSELVPVKDGDNLVLNFPDDTSVTLEGFYTQYNEDNLPTFNLDGTQATAEEFFAALNEPDLMPAAGPGAGTGGAATGAGRFHQFGDLSLTGGIDHLGALDWGMSRAFEPEESLNSVGRNSDSDWYGGRTGGTPQGPVNNPVTVTPTIPGVVPPGTVIPDVPGAPAGPGNAGIGAVADVLQVYEKGLVNGDQSLIQVNGSMDINAPDGVATIVMGGVTVWENGAIVPNVTISTDEGTFSNIQFNPETGKLTYTFTLDKNTTEHGQPGEDNIAHNIPVTVTDPDGDSDTAYITVVISDDVPEAVEDKNEITEGQTSVGGNVLDNDDFGADGPHKDSSVVLISNPVGEYGTIVLNPDGSYEFTLDNNNPDVKALKPGETLQQTYEYTITDADGDTSIATITITINGVNNPVTVRPDNPSNPFDPDPDVPGNPDDPNRPTDSDKPNNPDKPDVPEDKPGEPGDPDNPFVPNPDAGVDQSVVVVKESDLRDGEPVKVSDTLTVNAPDGVATIVIGGKVVYENGKLVPEADRTIETDEGQLVITGFDPDTGKLTYEFTLERPTDEHGKLGSDSISHTFQVTVTDVDGDEGSSYITVVVKDDVPEAVEDKNEITEGQTSVGGNVLDNDDFGADGKNEVSYVELIGDGKGEYGTITINPDGSYTFVLDNDNPDVKALEDGESLQQSYQYTITDKDGDTSTATITITINGVDNPVTITPNEPTPPDPDIPTPDPDPDPDDPDNPANNPANAVSDRLTVYEKDLGGDDPVQVNGAMNISAPDGLASIVIAGVTVWENGSLIDGAEVRTDEGVLNNFAYNPETGKLTYTYTLEQNTLEHKVEGADKLAHYLPVTVTDVDGDSASSVISVVVVDDVPLADHDSKTIKEDATEPVKGNVLDNDTEGADKWATDANGNITAVTNPGTYELTYGTLTINADGSYSYERNDTGVPDKGAQDSFVYTVVDKDGDTSQATLTINLENVKPIPTDPKDPDPNDPDADTHSINLKLNDSETAGDKSSTDSQRADLFDGPEDFVSARFDTASLSSIKIEGMEDAGKADWAISKDGQTLTGTFANGAVVTVTLGEIAADGSISISASLNEAAQHLVNTDSIKISGIGVEATDKGGSTAVNTNVSIEIADVKPVAEENVKEVEEGKTETGNVITDASPENALDDYNEDQAGTFENGASVTWNNLPQGAVYHEGANGKPGYYEVKYDGQGTVKLYDDGNYEFTADKNIEGLTAGSGNSQELVFDYSIIDSDGDVASSQLTIVLKPNNDVPTVDPGPSDPDPIPDPEDPDKEIDPEPIQPGTISGVIVADEGALAGGVGSGDYEHGYKGNASFTVQLNGEGGTVTLTYPIDNGDADHNPVTNTISFDLPAISAGIATTVTLEGTFTMPNGVQITLTNAVLNTETNEWTVNFRYELMEAQQHENDKHVGEQDSLQNIFTIDVVDETGDSAPQKFFVVEVHDDGPVLNELTVDGAYTTDNVPDGMEASTLPGNLISDTSETVTINLTDLSLGADKGPGNSITINITIPVDGAEAKEIASLTFTWAKDKDGNYGYQLTEGEDARIEQDENGNWQLIWTRPVDDVQEVEDKIYQDDQNDTYNFNVTVTDADGDSVSQPITVSTIFKPQIKEENPKDPEDPDDPDDKEPGDPVAPGLVADTLVTDDSYLGAGSKGGDSDKSEADSAAASGSFYVTLNGLPYNITIGDPKGNHAVISMNADGKEYSVKYYGVDENGNKVELSGEDAVIKGLYGEISDIEVVPDGDHARIDYTYTQTSAYQHVKEESPNPDQIADAEEFAIAIVDQVNNKADAYIQIKIEDDEPVLGELTANELLGTVNEAGQRVDGDGNVLGNLIHDINDTITINLSDLNFGADDGKGLGENGGNATIENGLVITVNTVNGNAIYNFNVSLGDNGKYKIEASKETQDAINDGTLQKVEIQQDANGNWQLIYTRPAEDLQIVEDQKYYDSDSDSYKFNIALTDSDGDTVSKDIEVSTLAKPVITETPKEDPQPVKPEKPVAELTTDESYIPGLGSFKAPEGGEDTSAKSYEASGSFGLTLNGREYTLTIDKQVIELDAEGNIKDEELADKLMDGTITIGGKYGYLTDITISKGIVSFTYVQDKAYDHGADNNAPDSLSKDIAESFAIKVNDHLNAAVISSIAIKIEDDAPQISIDGKDISAQQVEAGGNSTGSWDSVFGADLPDAKYITISNGENEETLKLPDPDSDVINSVTLSTAAGTLTVDSEGNYSFQALRGNLDDIKENFTFTIKDSDGDVASANLTINVGKDNGIPPAVDVKNPGDDVIFGDKGEVANDIIIADVHGQTLTPQSMNVALMIDTSGSFNDEKTGSDSLWTSYINSVKASIAHLADLIKNEGVAEIKLLMVSFDTVARNYNEYILNASNIDAMKTDIESVINGYKIGGINEKGQLLNGIGCHVSYAGGTNYEHPLSLVRDWFADKPGQNNQGFLITDGKPTVHIEDNALTSINNINVSNVNWADWTPGKNMTLTDGTNNFYVNETGVLCTNDTYTQALFVDTYVTRWVDGQGFIKVKYAVATIVLQKNSDGNYEPHQVGGEYQNNTDRFPESIENTSNNFSILSAGYTVNALGAGKDIDKNTLNLFDSDKNGHLLANFSQMTDIIKNTLNDTIGNDKVYGQEGRDILFADWVSDTIGVGEANIKALNAMVNLNQENVNMAVLGAAIFNMHSVVAENIDKEVDPHGTKGGNDVLVGGKDSDLLFGMGGNDLLIGDGTEATEAQVLSALDGTTIASALSNVQNATVEQLNVIEQNLNQLDKNEADSRDGNDILYGGHGDDILYGGGGNDILNGGTGNDVLIGGDGNDLLIGGKGDDILFGGKGDDVLIGGEGKDTMFGGEGNDLIFFDSSDYLIDGGDGLDIMVTKETGGPSLDAMLKNYTEHKDGTPMVNDVEVMISGVKDADSLTNMNDLAAKYGFSFSKDKAGNDILTLDANKGWVEKAGGNGETTIFENGSGITLETTMDVTNVMSTPGEGEEAAIQQIILSNSNG